MAETLRERLGVADFTDKRGLLWKACAAELVGNLLLNFFGCGSVLHISNPDRPIDIVQIALAFGLVIFVTVQVSNELPWNPMDFYTGMSCFQNQIQH